MDFALTDDQRAIQDAARAFSDAELAPHSARWDEDKHFPVDVMKQAAEMGFCGIYTGEEHGGMALGRVEAAVIFEELSRGDVATAAFISIHNMATWMIDRFGSDELRGRFVPSLVSMDRIASYCLTEPASGSDAAAQRTTAVGWAFQPIFFSCAPNDRPGVPASTTTALIPLAPSPPVRTMTT